MLINKAVLCPFKIALCVYGPSNGKVVYCLRLGYRVKLACVVDKAAVKGFLYYLRLVGNDPVFS